MYLLSQMTWHEIQCSPRHGLGSEKIDRNDLSIFIPDYFSEEKHVLALRFCSTKPMIGIRGENNIFHILFLDNKFQAYSHG